jgi:acetyl esterase/lipase
MDVSQTVRARAAALLVLALGCAACSGSRELPDVQYDDRFGESTAMDVYLPAESRGPRPAVMFIHGGGWSGGSRDHYTSAAKRLADSGWVTATIDYRLVPDGVFPHAVQDCLCALSYLRAHADELEIDPQRIAVMGYSAGGHLSSLLGVAADLPELAPDCAAGPTGPPAAVLPGAGVHDLRGLDHEVVVDFLGGPEAEAPERYALASPISHVAGYKPPFLLFHGDGDWIVPVEESRAMRDALVASGNDAELLEMGGVGHLVSSGADLTSVEVVPERPELWLAVADFLERTMGAPP